MTLPPVRVWTRAEMMKRVAFFKICAAPMVDCLIALCLSAHARSIT